MCRPLAFIYLRSELKFEQLIIIVIINKISNIGPVGLLYSCVRNSTITKFVLSKFHEDQIISLENFLINIDDSKSVLLFNFFGSYQ